MSREVKHTFSPLVDFVIQSNLIEGIEFDPFKPTFVDHLNAARNVLHAPELYVTKPQEIHRLIMFGIMPDAGEYRDVHVLIGGRRAPAPSIVPIMMEGLEDIVSQIFDSKSEPPTEQWLWSRHHQLEYIHPFRDGNGRTGRLWLNCLRQVAGYPWFTVRAAHRQTYYDSIVKWISENT